MSFIFTVAKQRLAQGQLDFREGSDIRALLVMTNTTATAEEDAEFVASLTTLDEFNGAGYVRKALANQAVTLDTVNNLAKFSADAVTWTALGAGTRQVKALILFRFVTNDTDSPLIAYIDPAPFPFTALGGDVVVTWDTAGIIKFT